MGNSSFELRFVVRAVDVRYLKGLFKYRSFDGQKAEM